MFDEYTEKHFQNWLDTYEYPEYREDTDRAIRQVVEDNPDWLETKTWSELRDLADYK